jgi:hypothetical protein
VIVNAQVRIVFSLYVLGCILVSAGLGMGLIGVKQRLSSVEESITRIIEVQSRKDAAVIQIFETPDHKWQIRVLRQPDGLFEIVPIDPENLPGGQPIGQKPGI